MQLDPAQRLAEIEASVAQYKRLLSQNKPEQLGEQAGYVAALWRQLAEWWRNGQR